MTDKAGLFTILNMYTGIFAGEERRTVPLAAYLHRNTTDQLYNRKNFDGHITTSAFIIDDSKEEILLLHHKSLGKWLQPGGHTEKDDSLVASALREAVEETGISNLHLHYQPVHPDVDVPFDVDSHYIPPNPLKNEEGHYHHDLRYVFFYSGDRTNDFNTDEATAMQWLAFDKLTDDAIFGIVVSKLRAFLATVQPV